MEAREAEIARLRVEAVLQEAGVVRLKVEAALRDTEAVRLKGEVEFLHGRVTANEERLALA